MALSDRHIKILQVVNAGVTTGEAIVAATGSSMQMLSHYITQMVEDGYLKAARVYDNELRDFIVVRAYLTPEGQSVLAKLAPVAAPIAEVAVAAPIAEVAVAEVAEPVVIADRRAVEIAVPANTAVTTAAAVVAPVEVATEVPVAAPVEAPVEIPVETPVAAPVKTPVETPAKTSVETSVETPVETPVALPPEPVFAAASIPEPFFGTPLPQAITPPIVEPPPPQELASEPELALGTEPIAAPPPRATDYSLVGDALAAISEMIATLPPDWCEMAEVYLDDLQNEVNISYRRRPVRVKAYFLALLRMMLPIVAKMPTADRFMQQVRVLSAELNVPVKLPGDA
jgi:hypothetical protein